MSLNRHHFRESELIALAETHARDSSEEGTCPACGGQTKPYGCHARQLADALYGAWMDDEAHDEIYGRHDFPNDIPGVSPTSEPLPSKENLL